MVVKTSSKTGEPIIQLRDLVNRFGTHTVHQALNLDVYRGEILGIVGGSGTGKSVLLRSLVGLQRPAAGVVHVMGNNLRQLVATHRSQIESRFGVLFQQGPLFSSMPFAANVDLPLIEHAGQTARASCRERG